MKPYLFLSYLLLSACATPTVPLLSTTHEANSCSEARLDPADARSGAPKTSTPPLLTDTRVVNVSYSEASSHKNDVVRWGGFIIDVQNEEDFSLIQIRSHPLDYKGHPRVHKPSEGDFVVKTSKSLDSGIYVKYSEVTVVGILDSDISLPVDGENISLPLIVLTGPEKYPYIWSEDYESVSLGEAAEIVGYEIADLLLFQTYSCTI